MKLYTPILMIITIFLFFSSCGKKQKNKNQEFQDALAPSESEIFYHALIETKFAIKRNDLNELKSVIKKYPQLDINQIFNETGDTPLIMAIKNDFKEIQNYLIEIGANLNKPNLNKETPLIVAAAFGRLSTIEILLEKKVDLEAQDANGDSALHVALKRCHDSVGTILINNGANIRTTDRQGKNAWILARENDAFNSLELIKNITELEQGSPSVTEYRSIIIEGDLKRLQRILNRYPQIASNPSYDAINPFALLIDLKNESKAREMAQILINYNANVNGPEFSSGIIPLIKAIVIGDWNFAFLLLNNGAQVQKLDKNGKSPLMYAVESNKFEFVDLLMNYSPKRKYHYTNQDKQISYNACRIVKEVKSKLKLVEEIEANYKIKKRLSCGTFDWIF